MSESRARVPRPRDTQQRAKLIVDMATGVIENDSDKGFFEIKTEKVEKDNKKGGRDLCK